MKKSYILLATALLCAFALSCTRENPVSDQVADQPVPANPANPDKVDPQVPAEVPEGYVRVKISAGAEQTKTTISDGAGNTKIVSWTAGDEIKVLYDGGSTTAVAETSGTSTQFTFDIPEGKETYYLVYPSAATSSLDGSTLSVGIPGTQAGAFAASNIMAAKGGVSDEGVQFYNACSLFKIEVSDATLKQATIVGNGGEALAGTLPIAFVESGITPGEATSTATTLTVNFNGTGAYYVAALPGLNLTTGATIKFLKEGETPGTYDIPAGGNKFASEIAAARSSITSLGTSDAICHRYVSTTADGSGNGRTSATAWNATQFSNFLGGKWNGTDTDNAKLLAMDGVTIHIAAGEYTLSDPAITLDAPSSGNSLFTRLSIVGDDGAVLKGNGTNKAILHQNHSYRAGTTVSFRNLTFTDGSRSGDHGGAIWQSYGIFKFKDCTFTGNKTVSDSKHGGVLHYYQSPVATFEDCTFSGNQAAGATANGGVMNITGNPTLTFTRCQFYGNSATNDGGVANVSGSGASVRFEDCDFGDGTDGNKNTTTNNGGVFLIEKASSLYVVGCRFNNNGAAGGGALNFPSTATVGANAVHVQGCSFTNHLTTNNGGVIRMVGGTLNLEKNGETPCTFTGNGVPSSSDGGKSGGVLYFEGTSTLNDNGSVYKQNYALWGGVCCVAKDENATINMESCVFGTDGTAADKNYSVNGGGVFNLNSGTLNLTQCEFYGNEAQNRPGGVLRRGTDGSSSVAVTIKGCTFKGNKCSFDNKDNGAGGVIYFDKGTLTLQKADDGTRNMFLNNTSFYRGGAIYVGSTAAVQIMESDFNGNSTTGTTSATQIAGGALNAGGTANVAVTDCSFIGNQAGLTSYGGGAIGTSGSTVTLKINQCLFKDNSARQGGALATFSTGTGATIYMNACAFTGNYSSSTYGCVIVLPNTASATATLCMNNCSFADNQYSSGSTDGRQCCWVNMKGLSKVVIANTTMIGRTRKGSASGTADSVEPNLLRFDGNVGTGNYLINNIIAMTPTSGTFYSSDIKGSTVAGYYNKMSTVLNGDNYTPGDGSASDFKGTSSYFGGLGSAMTEGNPAKWDNCYWSWNGTLETGSDLSKAALADVNTTIQTADSGFYTWLDSIGALTTDCRGKARGTTTWPGAYDGTNN